MSTKRQKKQRNSPLRDTTDTNPKMLDDDMVKRYISVTLALTQILLPPVKKYVQDMLQSHFKKLKSAQEKEEPGKFLVCFPFKPMTKFSIQAPLTAYN